jgi:hypothetical protein
MQYSMRLAHSLLQKQTETPGYEAVDPTKEFLTT